MKWVTRCPAKVNLFLAVGPPEPNGYHPIRTLFQAISLADTLTVELADAPSLTCNWPGLPAENTLTRVLRLIQEYVDLPPLAITLHKEIPAESGLGGGSSNAAGLLRILSRVGPALEPHFVADVAAAVGADVPFFLVGGRARGEGYGEQLTPLADAATLELVIVRPEVGVSTPAAYRALDQEPRDWRNFPSDPLDLYNDFERVAPCLCGEVAERLVLAGAEKALLSGSGSAVYGVFSTVEAADRAATRLDREALGQVWRAHTITRQESLWIS